MTAAHAAFALALLALLAPGVPAATSARRLLDNGAHAASERIQIWMLWCWRCNSNTRFRGPAKRAAGQIDSSTR